MLRRLVYAVITSVVVLYLLLVILGLLSDSLIFQPQRSSYRDAELVERAGRFTSRRADGSVATDFPAAEVIQLRSGGHPITALYLADPEAAYTLLFSHGNAEDLGDDLPLLMAYRDAGFSVFAYDYRGYGTSTGAPSERAGYQDVEAAYDYVTRTLGVSPSRVISFGRSVGCGAAIHLAAWRPVAALIAESPFISAFRVLTRVPLLPFDKFPNARLMPQIKVPVLVIHGERDRVIPFSHGQRIYELANEPKQHLWIPNAGHNDIALVAPELYLDKLRSFAATLPK